MNMSRRLRENVAVGRIYVARHRSMGIMFNFAPYILLAKQLLHPLHHAVLVGIIWVVFAWNLQ
jgi:hypothetical protein